MPHVSMTLSISVESLYNQLIQALATSFHCEPHQLNNRTHQSTITSQGKSIEVMQSITEIIVNEKIAFESKMNQDSILTIYRLEKLDQDSCKITMIEHASSKAISRSLNYLLLSLPGFKLFSKSHMKRRLLTMKQQFERNEI